MTDLACPICGYETKAWSDDRLACPNCVTPGLKRRLRNRLHNSDLEFEGDRPVLMPVEEAGKRRDIYESLGVIQA